ncbi:MAG: M48 family metalloprotease, partial [Planctomycetaceae bacterium]|nr:M48 family metalloprotease [Planctomycetaceae bacterium]
MNSVFFTHPLWSRLAATHLHFLWQGLVIAWLYWTVTQVFAVRSARSRYTLGMAGLLTMTACTIATFLLVETPQAEREASEDIATTDSIVPSRRQPRGSREGDPSLTRQSEENSNITSGVPVEPESSNLDEAKASNNSPRWLNLGFVGGWILGVLILGVRLMGGVGSVLWYRWSTLPLTDPQCLQLIQKLSRQVGLGRSPRLAISFRSKDAFSLGLWKPLIVLPASWLLQLPPQTLESVLAHELAHIRRWDAWATLFQRVLESALFYHPAVWWLSRQMDREREKCCDLWAVSVTGDRLQYVKALAGVAEIQHASSATKLSAPIFATGMGGKNMQLLERVHYVLGTPPRTGAASRIFAGAMVLAIPAALWVGTMLLPANAEDGENAAVAQAERERDGDRERGERREGDRPRDGERREGDRPRDGERREG